MNERPSGGAVPEPPSTDQTFIYAERGSIVFVVLQGDMHIRNGHPVYWFEPFSFEPKSFSAEQARQQPSRLLAAQSQVVKFTGREQELEDLAAWRDSSTSISVKLLHGSGGEGKTRLTIQFAADSIACGWKAWAAHHLSDPTARSVLAPGEPGRALLLVVEYADRWPTDDLLLLLQNPVLSRAERTRILLVARQAGPWWSALRHRLGKADINVDGSMRLMPMANTDTEYRGLFGVARDHFMEVFGVGGSAIGTPNVVIRGECDTILAVHMAALVAVDAYVRSTELPSDLVGLSVYLLDREYDFWQTLYDHRQVIASPRIMGRTTYVATLTRPLSPTQASATLTRTGIATGKTVDRILEEHCHCYPPTTTGTVLEPLYPDRLAEDFLALWTPGHEHPDYTPDRWASTAVRSIFSPIDNVLPTYVNSGLAVLIEAAHRWPHLANRHLYPLLRKYPRLALGAGSAALASLARIKGVDIKLLEVIERHFPQGRHIELDIGIAVVTQRLTEHRLDNIADPARRLELLESLVERFGNAGLHAEALNAQQRAIRIRRQFVSNPDLARSAVSSDRPVSLIDRLKIWTGGDYIEHESGLAGALDSLADTWWQLGQRDEAVAATEEKIAILRTLLPLPSGAIYDRELIVSLTKLKEMLSQVGKHKDALAAQQEAEHTYRQLAAKNPAAVDATLFDVWPVDLPLDFQYLLAATMARTGVMLYAMGQHDDAWNASRAVVDAYQKMAPADTDAFGESLADAFTTLWKTSLRLARDERALETANEAVAVYRDLAAANHAAFEPNLALWLARLGSTYSVLGQTETGLASMRESVDMYRKLATVNPGAFEAGLAENLDLLSMTLVKARCDKEASTILEEAIAIVRRLAQHDPSTYESALAQDLANFGIVLSRLGHLKEAHAATAEAVEIRRKMAERGPVTREAELARSMVGLCARLSDLGREQEAVRTLNEAIDIYRRLLTFSLDAQSTSATFFAQFGNDRIKRGRYREALVATQYAADLHWRLFRIDARQYAKDLIVSLIQLGGILGCLNAWKKSTIATMWAVGICRRLTSVNPVDFGPLLALSLTNLGAALCKMGRYREAEVATREALESYGRLIAINREAYESAYSSSVAILDWIVNESKRHRPLGMRIVRPNRARR